ncbi:LysE family transporter [Pseudomonas sp. 102515]|uniref:LysE family translocator n=1 Tax=Pseudomonas sp. 102515 TaxID=3071568 RepID=UPI002800BEB8|nr:LysE family transporter [Pseudomonas sp. 102515]MDQ7913024.1 LysE family transporter [Pseudomonas sp. 102515]
MSAYLSFAITVFLLISSPGPIVALVVADGRHGFPWWTILGGLLSAQVLLLLALGLIHLAIGISPTLLLAGQILGGLYLLWLGIRLFKAPTDEPLNARRGSFGRALLVGLSNPKDILFLVAFLPAFISLQAPLAQQVPLLLAIWAAIDLLVLVAYGHLAGRMHRLTSLGRLIQRLPSFALCLIGLASVGLGLRTLTFG